MERQASIGVFRCAPLWVVLVIPDYRVAEMGKVHANLMRSTGFRASLDQSSATTPLQYLEMRASFNAIGIAVLYCPNFGASRATADD